MRSYFADTLRPAAFAIALLATTSPAAADASDRIDPLLTAMGLPDLLVIMREEGMEYGRDLEGDLFPGQGRALWADIVAAIYDTGRMEAAIAGGLESDLTDDEIDSIVAFFSSETGEKIVSYEVAAREAMLDEEVEQSAREGWQELKSTGGVRWELLQEFAEVNDLVESNVAGAMTSNYAFYMGLVDGNAFEYEMSEDEVLYDVWSQEDAIRMDTEDWVFSFISLAYQPLSEEELQAYVDFASTPEGQALNASLFKAFNGLFTDISREMGIGAARFMSGQDI